MPVIPDVPAFHHQPDSGNSAFLAAQAALSAVKSPHSLTYLAGASGDAFRFVYDNAPVREPLRDLRPLDTLAQAFAVAGLRAEWVPDATLDHVRGQVEAHAKIGQPILTCNLPGEERRYCLLVGYDEDTDTLTYQPGISNEAAVGQYKTLKLEDSMHWHGPVSGAPYWVDFPMLVIRGALYDPPKESAQRKAALLSALDVLNGDPVPYPTHPGAQECASVPLGEREARQGLAALELLEQDLLEADLTSFDTLWRLNAQLRQLAWDRELAVIYLETWDTEAAGKLSAQYRTIAHTARTLLTRNWERRSERMQSISDLLTFIEDTPAYLYALPDNANLQRAARDIGRQLDTPWGKGLLVNTPQRRESASRLAGRLTGLEQDCVPLLEQALTTLP